MYRVEHKTEGKNCI